MRDRYEPDDTDDFEDYWDDIEQWAGVHDMIRREAREQFLADLRSVGLTPQDLADVAQDWDDLVRDAADPMRMRVRERVKEQMREWRDDWEEDWDAPEDEQPDGY